MDGVRGLTTADVQGAKTMKELVMDAATAERLGLSLEYISPELKTYEYLYLEEEEDC